MTIDVTNTPPRLPLPYSIDIETWASQLQAAFPNDWIPRLNDAQDWRRWAADFQGSTTFLKFQATVDPFQAKNWQEWAGSLVLVLPYSQ